MPRLQRGENRLHGVLHVGIGERSVGCPEREPHGKAHPTFRHASALIAIELADAHERRWRPAAELRPGPLAAFAPDRIGPHNRRTPSVAQRLRLSPRGEAVLRGLVDLSSFVTKVDAYLRLTRLSYRLERHPFLGIGNAPKGKLPFIEDDGERVADSGFIISHLKRRHGADLDAALEPQDRALSHAIRRMIEEHLYWVLVQQRWRIDENWQHFMSAVFGDGWQADPELSAILPKVRGGVLGQLHGHGIGRHSVDEVWRLGEADVDALSLLLGDQPYFLGNMPTSLDASAFSFLTHLQAGPHSPVSARIQSYADLTVYCSRMKDLLWSTPASPAKWGPLQSVDEALTA
jgi:glutathione S-transferase